MPNTQATICIEMEDKFTRPSKEALEEFKKQAQSICKELKPCFSSLFKPFEEATGEFQKSIENFDEAIKKMTSGIKPVEKQMKTFGDVLEHPIDNFGALKDELLNMPPFTGLLAAVGLIAGISSITKDVKKEFENFPKFPFPSTGQFEKQIEELRKKINDLFSGNHNPPALEIPALKNIQPQIMLTGEEQFQSNLEGIKDSMEKMSDGIQVSMDRLIASFDRLNVKVLETTQAFANMENEVVKNSYVPDMVDAIGFHFGRLDGLMVNPVKDATEMVNDSFSIMGDNVARSIDDLIFKGETRFESFRDFAHQTLTDIQKALFQTATGGQSIGGLVVGGLGNVLGNALAFNGGASQFTGRTFANSPGFFGPGFAHGGAFNVGGAGGIDSEMIRFMATPGERVTVETPEQQKQKGGGSVVINMDLRGSNGSQEIQQAIQKALRKVAPDLLDAAVWKVQDKYNREPRYLR